MSIGLEVNNSNIKRIDYHVKQLERFEKVRTKRIGKALIVWPHDIEKLRVIYELVKVE
jgi:predicted transcriptional regulator